MSFRSLLLWGLAGLFLLALASGPDVPDAFAAGSVFSARSCFQDVFVTTPAAGCVPTAGIGGPQAVAVSPLGDYVYAAVSTPEARLVVFGPDGQGGLKTVQCISVDGTDGNGGTCDTLAHLGTITDVEVTRDGQNVYVGSQTGVLFVFWRDQSTGHLFNQLPNRPRDDGCVAGQPTSTQTQPTQTVACTYARRVVTKEIQASWVAISPDDQFVYSGGPSVSSVVSVFQRGQSGALSQVLNPPDPQTSLGGQDMQNGDPRWCVTGVGTADAQLPDGSRSGSGVGACERGGDGVNYSLTDSYSLAFNSSGTRAYTSDFHDGQVFAFSRTSGQPELTFLGAAVAQVPGHAPLDDPSDVAVSPAGFVYVSYPTKGAVAVFSADLAFVGCIAESAGAGCVQGHGLSGANSLAVSPDGARLYAAGSYGASIAELAIDPLSGKLSQSTAPNDCAQTGTVDNCAVGVGALEQVQPGAAEPFAFTATLAASPHGSAPPTLYAAAFDGSALHIFDVPGGTHPTPLTSGQARLCSYRGHTFICLPLQCRLPKLCDGSLRVTLPVFAGPIAARIGPGLPRTVTLASARFKIRRGRAGTVRARITPAGARLLRGERRQHRKALTITVRFALRSAAPRYVREVTSLHL